MISHIEDAKRRGRRFWISGILLLAQLLTVTPILLIVSADQKQSAQSQRCLLVLQDLEQLAVPLKEMESTAYDGAKQSWPAIAWQRYRSQYRDEMEVISRSSSEIPGAPEILTEVDAIVDRMAQAAAKLAHADAPSKEADRLIERFLKDDERALNEIGSARGIVRLQLSSAAGGIAEKADYLKVLVAAACLLAFGVVFVFRGFRLDSATQRRLEQSLRSSNDEVTAALAAARDGSDAKNEALINVSEALRIPLNGMIPLTRKLLETELNAEQRDCAQGSLHSLLSLAGVIRDIQDFAKMESGRLDLVLEEFHPSKVIEDTLDTFRIAAKQKGLELEGMIAARLPASARGDAGRLRQILTNLMDNAVKFTERGRIMLSATDAGRSDGRIKLRFEVKDTGIGISEHMRGRLFEPLSLATRSATSERGGVGLGLAISKKLVELMGGEINLVSTSEDGSTFRFTVALELIVAGQGLQPHSSEKAVGGTHLPFEDVPSRVSPMARPESVAARDKRREDRRRISGPALLKSKTAGVAVIRLLDVSRFGLRVAVPFRVPAGTEVEIRIDDTAVHGLVRHCECMKASEFHIGIELLLSDSIDERGLTDFVRRRARC